MQAGPGGWWLTGQKVWTSLARQADWAICLARTDVTAAKHRGITYFLMDMNSDGIDIRLCEDLGGARVADSKDVGETDARLFVVRDIDSSNTCHGVPFRLGSCSFATERGEWFRSSSTGSTQALTSAN